MRYWFLSISFLVHFVSFGQTKITISIADYKGDSLYVGREVGKEHTVLEKLMRKSPNEPFIFVANKQLGESVLFAQKPSEKKSYQFLFHPNDTDFDVIVETKNKLEINFKNHPKNSAFYPKLDYVVKLSYRIADSLSGYQQMDSLLTLMQSDQLINAIDSLFSLINDRPSSTNYFINQLLNLYQTQHVGFDKAYIHLVDKYVKSGKYNFSPEEITNKSSQADEYRNLMINSILPDFTVFKENKEAVNLYSLQSNIIILIFWSPTCSHCQKAMPQVALFNEKYKNDNLKILAICDKGGDKVASCWPFIQQNKMSNLINAADSNRTYNQKLRMRKIPKIFILDKNKKVILKDFNILEIEKYYNYCKAKIG